MASAKLEVGTGAPNPFAIEIDALDDAGLLGLVAAHYHTTLLGSATARTWLQRRGLGADELVEHFGLGFANRTLGLRLQELGNASQHRLRSRLQELGVFRRSGHEHLRGCIALPRAHRGSRSRRPARRSDRSDAARRP